MSYVPVFFKVKCFKFIK